MHTFLDWHQWFLFFLRPQFDLLFPIEIEMEPKDRLMAETENNNNDDDDVKNEQRFLSIKSRLSLHPLEHCWVFWHYRRARRRSTKKWMDCQRTLVEIDTIESFWMFFAKQRSPSMVRINQDYALFKKGIKPMWEDPANMNGGQWIFILQKSQDNYDSVINEIWYKIIMAMLGSIFKPEIMDQICGIVFSMRISCFTKISIWVNDYRAIKQILILGNELKRLTKFNDCIVFRRNDNMQTKFIL
nr:eukaryotic translation initiation factor 4E-1A-like [Dermatophagoides farinae]